MKIMSDTVGKNWYYCLIKLVQSIGTHLEMRMKEKGNLSLSKRLSISLCRRKRNKKLSCIIPKGQERYYTAKKKSYFTLEISTRSNQILNTGSRQVQQAQLSPNFLPAVMIQVIVLRIQLFIVNTKVWEQADEPK